MTRTPAVLLLLFALFAFAFEAETSVLTHTVRANASCAPYQTACAMGCCPYADAVCCTDGYECCQHGEICISYLGICIGLDTKEEEEKPALVSNKATPLENLSTPCPSGTTTCGPNKCCPYPNANCCWDGVHCCPFGYRCDLPHQRCLKNSDNDLDSYAIPFADVGKSMLQKKAFLKPSYKSCPGGSRQCPSDTSCCLNDEEDWSCCPKPSSNVINKVGTGECCETLTGFVCCPDIVPHCTVMGCRP